MDVECHRATELGSVAESDWMRVVRPGVADEQVDHTASGVENDGTEDPESDVEQDWVRDLAFGV